MRIGSIWKGEFAEMSGVWRGQGSGNVGERSREIVRFPVGPAMARLESATAPWPSFEQGEKIPGFQFQGYTLDKKQRPTFRYRFHELEITDAFVDESGGPTLARTLTFSQTAPADLHLRLAADKDLKPGESEDSFLLPRGLEIHLPSQGRLRPAGDLKELLLPLHGRSSVEISYTFTSE